MTQESMLPKWLWKALLIAVAAVIALVVLWFALLKPTVESAAKQQAQREVAAASDAAEEANQAASAANDAAEEANKAAADPGGDAAADEEGAGAEDGSGTGTGAGAGGSAPVSFRILADTPVVTDGSFRRFTYTPPDGQVVDIGDVVLQNPRGDSGFLRVSIGDVVVLDVGLANFRDLDYHYVVPLRVAVGQPVVLSVNCVAAGGGAPNCTPSAAFSGRLSAPPSTTPAPAGG